MELCVKCPMRDERYVPSDQQDRKTISDLRHGLATMGDFIEYLFDHSEHCDHISYSEAWEEFQQWRDKQDYESPN